MRIEDKESSQYFKKYIAEAIARYQIEHNLPVDDLSNWYHSCRYHADYFGLAGFKITEIKK